jgi:haloalkane dehalogenase
MKPGVLRTPNECFAGITDFPYEPHYMEVDGYRIHCVDEGPRDAAPILLMHGEPSWCYLYRKMIGPLFEAGHRCVAPDLVGFGRSDKLARREDYSYQFHVDIMNGFVRALDLKNITLFGQDWGELIGLRVLVDNLDRFSRHLTAVTDRQVADLGITLTPQHPERELRVAGALFESSTKMRVFFAITLLPTDGWSRGKIRMRGRRRPRT